MSKERIDPDLSAFEAVLLPLAPSPSTVDRDRLMFLAGEASGRRSRHGAWLWPGTALAATALAGVLGVMLAFRPKPDVVERVVYVALPQQDIPPQTPDEGRATTPPSLAADPSPLAVEYFRLRRLVLARGLDAVPEPKPSSIPGKHPRDRLPIYQELLEQLMKG
jgi:hypothetical protein